MNKPSSWVEELARNIVEAQACGDLRGKARNHIIDTLGVAVSGSREQVATAVLSVCGAPNPGAHGGRSICSPRRLTLRDAAMCNAVAGHAHDFDDDEPHLIVGHPSVAVVGALLALADAQPLTLSQALDAYLVGTETMAALGQAVNPDSYYAGWHCTATLGVFGAAAATARVLGLSVRQTANAMNLAATFAGGLRQNFGTDGKPLQVGVAAGNGVMACELSLAGLVGAHDAIEGQQGFFAMNASGVARARARTFGKPWAIENPGFNIKLYPCCSSTHTAIDALLDLRARTRWLPQDMASIQAWVGSDVPGILIHDVPSTPLEGKFSLRYCLAYAAGYGRVGFEAFEKDAVLDEQVRSIMARTSMSMDATLPRAETGVTHQSRVRITSVHGEAVECSYPLPRGSAEHPIGQDAMHGKFISCASYAIGGTAARRLCDVVHESGDSSLLSSWIEALHEKVTA